MADSCIACAIERTTSEGAIEDSLHTCEKGSGTSTQGNTQADGRYTFADYQDDTASTAIYPDAGKESTIGITYTVLGLAGEAGEIANKWKKYFRDAPNFATHPAEHDDFYAKLRDAIIAELSDVLWYASQLATELGVELGDVAAQNIRKLSARQKSGTIQGSGDDR